MKEENFSSLINFLNYNVSDLNKNLKKLYQSILSNSETETKEYLMLATNQLIDWHPFFKDNTIYYICDLLIHSAFYELAYIDLENTSEDFTFPENSYSFCCAKIIETICNKITNKYPDSNNDYFIGELSDYFQNTYKLTSPYPYYWNSNTTSLGYIEKFREYLAENMPQIRYDSNSNLWNDFFNDMRHLYGSTTLEEHVTLNPSPIEELLLGEKPLAPMNGYRIKTFPQYILTQIQTIKQHNSVFRLCPHCGIFYLHNPRLINHKCKTEDYYKDMKEIYHKTYKRLYSRATTDFNNQIEDTLTHNAPIDILQNSGLLDFHNKTYSFAIRHHISLEIYKHYTSDINYTFDKFYTLQHISKYTLTTED